MRLSVLIDAVARLRRLYIAVAEASALGNRDMAPRLKALSAVISDLESQVEAAELAKDPLASLIYRTQQELRIIVNNPRKQNLKRVRGLAEKSYSEACPLGLRDDFKAWRQLLSAGICEAI